MISIIADIEFAHISCCSVGQAAASFAVVKNNLLLAEYAEKKLHYFPLQWVICQRVAY